MTGLEVARQLHALRPGLPVILASGFSADLKQEDLQAAGICELLSKPTPWTVLAEAVHRSLATQNGRAKLPVHSDMHLTDNPN
jgi:CheY-like chemotaxis protein